MENVSDPFVTRLDEVQDFDFDEPIEEDDEPFVAAVNRLETRDDDLLKTAAWTLNDFEDLLTGVKRSIVVPWGTDDRSFKARRPGQAGSSRAAPR